MDSELLVNVIAALISLLFSVFIAALVLMLKKSDKGRPLIAFLHPSW